MNARLLFFLLSFLEGASVMAAELLGAKMLSPYFGSSLYVWASVLGITLGGLALGYFSGGILSTKQNPDKKLYAVLLASAVFLIMMPVLARAVMIRTVGLELAASAFISSGIFLFPPVFFMGMVSPLLVRCLAHGTEHSGKAAGTVFAVSTAGGILATFLLGFYIIPEFGITKPAIITGIILGIIPFFKLMTSRKFFSLIFPLAAFLSLNNSALPAAAGIKIHYTSEGLLGQIIVKDYSLIDSAGLRVLHRILLVNRSTQTIVTFRGEEKEYFEYVKMIADKAGDGSGKRALILGLGGGSVASVLAENNFLVDAVELDERMAYAAKQFFDLDGGVKVFIDDARHFVIKGMAGSDGRKYDLIILDAFIGEVNPHHLFTKEFFSQIKSLLAYGGTFFINGNGYWNGETGMGMRSVCKTLLASGFDVRVSPTSDDENYRNILFEAVPVLSGTGTLSGELVQPQDSESAVILEDEKPCLEILNARANKKWREAGMKYFLSGYYSGQDKMLFK